MTATADYSDGKVPKNETAFPLCSATDSLWNKNVVSSWFIIIVIFFKFLPPVVKIPGVKNKS